MKLGISERDKFLLCLLGSVLVVFLAYYFGFRNYTDKTEALETEINSLKVKYDDLRDKANNAQKYKDDTENYNILFDSGLSLYDSGFSQKATLMFTTELENELDVWLRTVSMPDAALIYTFGNVTSSNPSASGASVYSTDMQGYRKTVTYSYECDYDTFKDLLAYILDYDTVYTIDSVSCSYNEEEELMSGNITISQYAITGSDREYYESEIDSIDLGTKNLFVSETNPNRVIESADDFGVMTNYDIALSLSSEGSDLSSVVLGRRGYSSSQVSANTNDNVPVVINISGESGEYTISYSVGDEQYPSPEQTLLDLSFNPGRSLDLIVFSCERESDDDMSGASVTINNESDMTLNIKVVNDDSARPRFNVESVNGAVKYYR